MTEKNKYQVTFTFPTEKMLNNFCGWFCDGGGEDGFFVPSREDDEDFKKVRFDYTRCFPAWGWKKGEPKFIDIEILEE